MADELISIVVPIYNVENYLRIICECVWIAFRIRRIKILSVY
ncbi:Uncharacterised protein [Streptococcus pneumoniae]|nr:Uncharacterised protein [Streptococcus pneumoniae]CVQ72041.1 Uncharacterised protein [Streptococcus pneumoniae]